MSHRLAHRLFNSSYRFQQAMPTVVTELACPEPASFAQRLVEKGRSAGKAYAQANANWI